MAVGETWRNPQRSRREQRRRQRRSSPPPAPAPRYQPTPVVHRTDEDRAKTRTYERKQRRRQRREARRTAPQVFAPIQDQGTYLGDLRRKADRAGERGRDPSRGGHPSQGLNPGDVRRERRPRAYRLPEHYRAPMRDGAARAIEREVPSLEEAEERTRRGLRNVRIHAGPGFIENALDDTLGPLAGLGAKVGVNTVRSLVESGDTRRETLRGFRDIPAGFVMGVAGAVTDPIGTAKGMGEQYAWTYGPALEGDWDEFRRRQGVEGQGGAVQVLADGTIIVGGLSALAGRAARAGMLGSKAKATMTAPRPRLRYTGNDAFEQDISPLYFRARRQRRRDESRLRVSERRRQAQGNEEFGPVLRPRQRPERQNGVLTGGEVVARGGLELPGRRVRVLPVPLPSRYSTSNRLQRKQGAREKGQRRIVQLEEQHALQRLYANTVGLKLGGRFGNLSAGQQKAFRYVYGGLMAARDVPSAIRHLRERREQILDYRRELSAAGKRRSLPGPRRRFNEELRVIDDLIGRLEAGDPVLTETLAGAAGRMRRAEIAIARGRPDLEDVPIPGRVSQTQLRRYAPQAEFLARMDMRARAAGESREGMLPAMKPGETPGSYIGRVGLRRVLARAQEEGMLRPGYFPSERRFQTRFSDSAIGGSRGTMDDRSYTGELFRRGEEDTRPEVLLAGLMRGVKRRHNINLIAEQVAKHAIDLGPTMSEISAAKRRGAREEARQREAALSKFLQMQELESQRRAVTDEIREMAESVAPGPAFWEELENAQVRFDEAIEEAKGAGDLERWRALRAEKAEIEREFEREVDRHTRVTAMRERARARLDALEGEMGDLRESVAPESRSWFDKISNAEADVRAAHEGLFHARRMAPAYVDDAQAVLDGALNAYDEALMGARANVAEVAGSRAVEAAHMRIARDVVPGPGRTIKELVDDLETARIDPAEVMFFNPGRIYATYSTGGRSDGTPIAGEQERFGFEALDQGEQGMLEALQGNVLRGDVAARRIKSRPEEFQQVQGWVALPRAVGEEIMSSTKPEFLASRIWDIHKGKFSRVLLGLGNISWLAFQVGSNAFLSGIFGKVGPLDWYRSQVWWKSLTDDERSSLKPILGQSAHMMDFDRRYLGAAAANNTIVNAKRAMEKSALWQQARRGNPIDLMFKLDAHQNLFFRRALLYSEAKKRMFDRMGETTHDMVRLQDRIEGTLTKSADRQLTEYLEDKPTLELHGRKVDELLGDYLTYTNAERRILQRFVMFYGFVRHSTRLALWTLPTQHPIAVGILSKLALLGQEEARELLGGDQLPWGLGKFYFRGSSGIGRALDLIPGVSIEDSDRVMEIELGRMSPATNAFLDIRSANQAARIFPPMLSIAIAHIAEEDLNTGKDWQVRGMTRESLKRFNPLGSPYSGWDHIKVLAGELSRTIPPVRYAERVLFTGPQGDDASLLFGPAETKYRADETVETIEEARARTLSRPAGQRLLDVVFPMLPKPSEDPRIVENRIERQEEADKAEEAFHRRGDNAGRSERERMRGTLKRPSAAESDEILRRMRETLRGGG